MIHVRSALPASLLTLLLLFAACQTSQDAGEPGTHTVDTTQWMQLHDTIGVDHDRLMARYEKTATQMSPEMRQLYQSMQQMYGRAAQMRGQMMGGGMMGQGMMRSGTGMMGMYGMREWDRQMLSMHERMAAMHRQHGEMDMVAMHEQMMRRYEETMDATGGVSSPAEGPSARDEIAGSGAALFDRECSSCHGAEGRGMMGVFPPLAGSEWVTEENDVLIRILLHGLEGPIEVGGRSYEGVMPAFGARLSDEEIAAILTHLRSSWGNRGAGITEGDVSTVRRSDQGRTRPWSPSELR